MHFLFGASWVNIARNIWWGNNSRPQLLLRFSTTFCTQQRSHRRCMLSLKFHLASLIYRFNQGKPRNYWAYLTLLVYPLLLSFDHIWSLSRRTILWWKKARSSSQLYRGHVHVKPCNPKGNSLPALWSDMPCSSLPVPSQSTIQELLFSSNKSLVWKLSLTPQKWHKKAKQDERNAKSSGPGCSKHC